MCVNIFDGFGMFLWCSDIIFMLVISPQRVLFTLINPWRMNEGFSSLFVCVCYHASSYICTPQMKIFYGVFKIFVVWLSLKMLHSKVVA